MMKRLILAAVAVAALTAPAAAQTLKFAIVPKAMNNPYFDLSRDGCMKRAKELGIEPVDTVEAMLPRVDYLTVHTPLTDETRILPTDSVTLSAPANWADTVAGATEACSNLAVDNRSGRSAMVTREPWANSAKAAS